MALSYRVLHAFADAKTGTYYTRENEADVKRLPRALRDDLIKNGRIAEYDDGEPTEATAAAEDEPAPTSTRKKEK